MENYEKIIFKSAWLSTTESFLFTFIRIIAVIRVMIVIRMYYSAISAFFQASNYLVFINRLSSFSGLRYST